MWTKYFLLYAGLMILAWTFSIASEPIYRKLCLKQGYAFENAEGCFLTKNQSQILKGVAILCVILCHYMGHFGGSVVLFTPFGGIGVSVFLILSAYGINTSWNRGGYKCWIRKRIIAVIIPYMIIEIICYWPFYDFSLSGFLLDITCIKPMYTNGWYLQYLVTWYLIFYIVKRVVKPEKWKAVLLFCVISAVMFFTMPEIKAEQSLSFLTGIVLSEYYDSQKIRSFFRRWWIGSIFLFIGVVALAVKQTSIIREGPQLLYNLMQLLIKWPCAIGLIILVLCLSEKISLRFFLMAGTISYELYIIHGYVFGAVSVSIVGAVLFIVTSVVVSSVYWLFISKVLKPVLTKALRVE